MSRADAGQAQTPGSRERILAATAELVRQRGLDGTTIAAVCERTGLPVSSIYWHFEDKDTLFVEVLHASYTRWLSSVASWSELQMPTRPPLEQVLERTIRSLQTMPDFLVVGMQLLLERRDQYQRARMHFSEIRAQITGMVTVWVLEALQPDPEPVLAEELARLVLALSDGAMIAAQVDADFDVDDYVELFLSTFVRAAQRDRTRAGGDAG